MKEDISTEELEFVSDDKTHRSYIDVIASLRRKRFESENKNDFSLLIVNGLVLINK